MRTTTRIRNARKQRAPEPFKDANGDTFDTSRHVAPDAFTAAGLFRLKPGKRRA